MLYLMLDIVSLFVIYVMEGLLKISTADKKLLFQILILIQIYVRNISIEG